MQSHTSNGGVAGCIILEADEAELVAGGVAGGFIMSLRTSQVPELIHRVGNTGCRYDLDGESLKATNARMRWSRVEESSSRNRERTRSLACSTGHIIKARPVSDMQKLRQKMRAQKNFLRCPRSIVFTRHKTMAARLDATMRKQGDGVLLGFPYNTANIWNCTIR